MNFIKRYIPFFCIFVAAIVLIIFRSVPSKKLWDDYTVLYVPAEVSDDFVIKALESSQIYDFVCLKNQRVPILLSANSPEVTMLKLNSTASEKDYLYTRENYFYDSTGSFKLFYIPTEYKKSLNDCLHILDKKGIKTGIDIDFSYPWLLPILISVYFIVLLVFSKKKLLFILLNIFPLLFIFSNPFYAAGTSVVLLQTALFIVSNVWGRKNAKKQLLKTSFILIFLVISIASSFSSSIRCGVFYLISLAGSFSFLSVYDFFKVIREKKMNFVPVYIKSAGMISAFAGNGKIIMPISLGMLAVILLYFALSFTSLSSSFSKKIKLPGLSNSSEESLPSLEDYYSWNWKVFSSPFKSLNKSYSDDKYFTYPSFISDENSITQKDNILSFDDSFKENVYNGIDSLDFDSIEKVLKAQEKDAKYGYVQTGSYKVTLFSIIMMFISFGILLFIYFSVIIKKGGKK